MWTGGMSSPRPRGRSAGDAMSDKIGAARAERSRIVSMQASRETPPMHDHGAERAVLSAMLLDSGAGKIRDLEPTQFHLVAHGKAFAAMLALHARGEQVDTITLAAELRRRGDFEVVGGHDLLSRILDSPGTTVNLDTYARSIRSFAARRARLRELEDEIERTRNGACAPEPGTTANRFVAASLSGPLILNHEFPPPLSILGNGITSAGDLMVMFGEAGLGKTSLALALALAQARGEPWMGLDTTDEPANVGFLELELHGHTIQDRLKAIGGEIPESFHLLVRP